VKYIVISPVKDEEKHVRLTLDSMVSQSVKPVRWIIVDDGSRDRTGEILESYQREHSFISVVKRPPGQARQPGSAVVHAFNRGYEAAKGLDYDLIVKLDCDLSFESDYFQQLLAKFEADPQLGIASGVYAESSDGTTWQEVAMPSYHACGASKVVRRTCFEQIGGFIPARGWDTVDEIRAMAGGWHTAHFSELKMRHWKPEGTGIGSLRTNFMHGEIYYRTGGSRSFFLLKVLHRMTRRPFVIGGLALLWGYVRTLFSGRGRLVTWEEARCYRALLKRRMVDNVKGLLQPN
jgi:hypothetical protein